MPITPRGILNICAAVARSHGKQGEVIAIAIGRIDLNELFGTGPGKLALNRLKYTYRKVQGGREYVYFRMPNGQLFPLPADQHSAEFHRQYKRCLRLLPIHRRSSKTLPKNTA